MATPTTLFSNWTGVVFTPSPSGSAITLNRISSVEFDPGGQLTPYSGDANRFPTGMFLLMSQPRATVSSANLALLTSIAPGALGTLVAILNDVKNGAGAASGALQFTLSNAVAQNFSVNGQHAQIAGGQISFMAYSSDGVTSPLAVVVL